MNNDNDNKNKTLHNTSQYYRPMKVLTVNIRQTKSNKQLMVSRIRWCVCVRERVREGGPTTRVKQIQRKSNGSRHVTLFADAAAPF